MLKEFRDFILRGNVLDLAVAVIIGGAFSKIISSLVNDLLMPPIGLLLGKVDFSNLYVNMGSVGYASLADAKAAGAPTLNYGVFLINVIDFLIVSLVIFLIIKVANKFPKPISKQDTVPATKDCPFCCSPIPVKAKRCPHCTSNLEG